MPYPESERLIYSPVSRTDIDFIMSYLSDPVQTRYLPNGAPYPDGLAIEWAAKRILHWETHGFGTYILTDKKSGEKIGFCGLEYAKGTRFIDIRYGLVQDAWGKGLAFEAGTACIQHGFSCLDLDTIYGAAVPENIPSSVILKKLGMTTDSDFIVYGDTVDTFSIKKTTC